MQIIMGVRNFGRIEYAEADINGFSVFVGNNNSGKTYMMQLIYGFRKNLKKYTENIQSSCLDRMREAAKNGKVILDTDTVKDLEAFLNEILEKKKEQIVLETFNKNITIGALYVKILFAENERMEYLLWDSGEKNQVIMEIAENLHMPESSKQSAVENMRQLPMGENGWLAILVVNHFLGEEKETQSVLSSAFLDEYVPFQMVIHEMRKLVTADAGSILFMPASRTGLLMLYKEFFAHKTDETMRILKLDDGKEDAEADIGLTQPVYEFVRFIQTFRPDKKAAEKNKHLIRFMEEYLMEGKIYLDQGDQVLYQGKDIDQGIPLYLSSSMINELAPTLYALESVSQKEYIIWDEIETSLHPRKQMELVRLLSRMNNQGIKLIVSTHSDTMATKINNLCMLSYSRHLKSRQEELLNRAELEQDDLLQNRIHIYQFTNDDNGKSHASELLYNEFTGYEFTQFNDSVEKLFQETKWIME